MKTKRLIARTANRLSANLKSMILTGYSSDTGAQMIAIANKTLDDLPRNVTLLREPKQLLKNIVANVRDLTHAVKKEVLSPRQVRQELKLLRATVRQDLKAAGADLPDTVDDPEAMAAARRTGTKAADLDNRTVLGDSDADVEVNRKLVNQYHKKYNALPDKIKEHGGTTLVNKAPVIVTGIMGAALEKLRALIRVRQFIEGYIVMENQFLLGIDEDEFRERHGGGPTDPQYIKYANEILDHYNSRASTPLALVSENYRRKGRVLYFWVMPEKVLNYVMRRGVSFDTEWGLPSKIKYTNNRSPNKKLTDERLELIFRLAIKGLDLQQITNKVWPDKESRPTTAELLIARLLRGEEDPERTQPYRERYTKVMNKQYHRKSEFMKQKRQVDLELHKGMKKSPHKIRND